MTAPSIRSCSSNWGPPRRPTEYWAAPTYLIDGSVIFLGNPEPGELLAALDGHHLAPARDGQTP